MENYMKEPTLGNPQNTIAVLQKYNFVFQKKFGQNFLIDTHVLDKIIRAAEIGKDDCVLEIGPGIGTMTQYLACAAKKVIAVEIDRALIPILQDTLDGYDNVKIINEDVLKVDIAKLAEEENGGKPLKVVANLPYYITTPIIMGSCAASEHYCHGPEGGSGPDADRAGLQGLRRAVSGGTVLREAVYRGKCSAELLYAPPESGICGDPPGTLQRAAGKNRE